MCSPASRNTARWFRKSAATRSRSTLRRPVCRIHIRSRRDRALSPRHGAADITVCAGAELEIGWLPMLEQQAANPKIATGQPGHFEAARFVRLLEAPAVYDRSM